MFRTQLKLVKEGIRRCNSRKHYYCEEDYLREIPYWSKRELDYKKALAILTELQRTYRKQAGWFGWLNRNHRDLKLGLYLQAKDELGKLESELESKASYFDTICN